MSLSRLVPHARQIAVSVALGAAMFAGAVGGSHAQDFYKGKTIEIYVSSRAGTAHDLYARNVAAHMGQYIPGNPSFIVKNLPGAGGLKVAHFMNEQAPKDGTVIAATQNGLPIADMLTPDKAKFNALEFNWIGSVSASLYTGYFWNTAPINKFEEAFTKEGVIVGGPTPGSFSVDMAVLSNEILGTKFKIITGYDSSAKVRLAMEQGELHGYLGASYATLNREQPTWVKDGIVKILMQATSKRNPQLPDVPAIVEFAKNDADRAAIEFVVDRLQHGRPYYAPPGVPAERVNLLRRAFEKTLSDKGFLDDMAKLGVELDSPMNGEELEALVRKEHQTPKEIQDRVATILEDFRNRSKN